MALAVLLTVTSCSLTVAEEQRSETSAEKTSINFDRQIRPILSNACFTCHGPDQARREADLRLDQEASAKEGVIVEGDPDASELIHRIFSDDPDEQMPPPDQKQQLSSKQKNILKRWVAERAPWSQHWSFIAPKREPLPSVDETSWPQVGIDHFVLARLEEKQLAPSPRAARETLIRRVTFDLTGLPPTLEEIDAFLADDSVDAFERVVDRLLASPRYGEHMALPWLAAARYADSNGYQNDATRTMWPWRDWVIRAMNDNLPFDKFTLYQLAGDLLENPTRDQLIATGFHRNHGLNGEGGRDPEESRVEYVIDRAETTGTVWLGLTVGCARCHDHKYDDVPQKEFYKLYAYFNSIDERGGVDAGGNAKPVLALPTEEQLAEVKKLQQDIKAVEQRLTELPSVTTEEQEVWEQETSKWLTLSEQEKLWQPLQQVQLKCKSRANWKQLSDHSVLVSEMADSTDDYVVTINLPTGKHQALRIEAMKHPQLVFGLFSTGIKGGFSVTGLEVELDGKPIKLVDAEATVGGKRGAEGLLDTSKFTAWSVSNPKRAPQVPTWLANFEEPIEVVTGKERTLTVRMRHQSRTGEAPIGRFRLSLTAYAQPTVKKQLGLSNEVVKALRTPLDKRTPEHQKQLASQLVSVQQAPLRKEISILQASIKKKESKYTHTMIMRDRKKTRDTYRLVRGLWNNPDKTEKLHPEVLGCLPAVPEDAPRNRLTLAQWLVSPEHPLTARVTVNRYWQHFFGVGIVKTSEDFGVQGERPSHPKLLDWLAADFIQSGWDVKRLHKLIVMSATYQQSSMISSELAEQDPYNRLLARGPRFRLSAQSIRDQALMLSGLLVEKRGGPGVMPYQPKNVWSDYSLGKIKYKQGKGEDLYRRSVYTFWRRSVGPTMFFDNAARQVCTVRPSLTNTPLHSLTLLNDVTYIEAARVLAQRIFKESRPTTTERIELAFRMATARKPSAVELESLDRALQDLLAHFKSDPAAAAEFVSAGEAPQDESLDVVELAAYTSLMNALLNLDEVITKG